MAFIVPFIELNFSPFHLFHGLPISNFVRQDRVFFLLLLHFVSEIVFLAVKNLRVRLDYLIDFLVDLLKQIVHAPQDNVGKPEPFNPTKMSQFELTKRKAELSAAEEIMKEVIKKAKKVVEVVAEEEGEEEEDAEDPDAKFRRVLEYRDMQDRFNREGLYKVKRREEEEDTEEEEDDLDGEDGEGEEDDDLEGDFGKYVP